MTRLTRDGSTSRWDVEVVIDITSKWEAFVPKITIILEKVRGSLRAAIMAAIAMCIKNLNKAIAAKPFTVAVDKLLGSVDGIAKIVDGIAKIPDVQEYKTVFEMHNIVNNLLKVSNSVADLLQAPYEHCLQSYVR